MATGHMLTNRGRLLLLQGAWDDVAATIIRCALLKAVNDSVEAKTRFEAVKGGV